MENLNSKYFIPDIEDIRVGYECEIFARGMKDWRKYTYKKNDLWQPIDFWNDEKITEGKVEIRVPYLTKEDIESLGWKQSKTFLASIENSQFGLNIYFTKGIYSLYINTKDHKIRIRSHNNLIIYLGICKDVNTLKYLEKLLKIC